MLITPAPPQVRVGDTGTPGGRGLIASEEMLPEEVILSIPLEITLMEASDGEGLEDPELAMWSELPWSVRMAIRVLRGLESSGVAGGVADEEAWRRPWLEQLPAVDTPPFSFAPAQLHQARATPPYGFYLSSPLVAHGVRSNVLHVWSVPQSHVCVPGPAESRWDERTLRLKTAPPCKRLWSCARWRTNASRCGLRFLRRPTSKQ
jgi:hypothetical protein